MGAGGRRWSYPSDSLSLAVVCVCVPSGAASIAPRPVTKARQSIPGPAGRPILARRYLHFVGLSSMIKTTSLGREGERVLVCTGRKESGGSAVRRFPERPGLVSLPLRQLGGLGRSATNTRSLPCDHQGRNAMRSVDASSPLGLTPRVAAYSRCPQSLSRPFLRLVHVNERWGRNRLTNFDRVFHTIHRYPQPWSRRPSCGSAASCSTSRTHLDKRSQGCSMPRPMQWSASIDVEPS